VTPSSRRSPPRQWLRTLAEVVGIVPEYLDQTGRHVRRTSDETREVLLSIMGFDAPTEDAARAWLDELEHEDRSMLVPPVRVVERDDASARRVHVRLPAGTGRARVRVDVLEEAGHRWRSEGDVSRARDIGIPTRLPYGYHRVTVTAQSNGREWSAEQSLIVVPRSCVTPRMVFGKMKAMGVVANLYSVRREHDWGVGDFTTLTQLVEWSAQRGAHFVGVNPLHALYNRGMDISPYSPVSRLFRNPLYIDVEAVPELTQSPAARALLAESSLVAELQALRAGRFVDYDRVVVVKERVLRELHRTFSVSRGPRIQEYHDFVRQREPELTRFATWMALAESAGVPDWRQWPEPLQAPSSPSVTAFAEANTEHVDFHRWLQFEAHRQLHETAEHARTRGMKIGVYQDLAIGTSGGGSDTWSYPELFLTGASIGAPPDPYSATGQVWGLPPMDPRVLRSQGYRYWIQLLRRAFEHAGALRIDHVMGLFRTFWIPSGGTGQHGAYVRFPAKELLGILALESVRHDALVVGEDLGTVPAEVPPALKKWGILSSKVLYFERERNGAFKAAKRYPPLSLATANTHDMPTLAGFWTEHDVELRARVGLIPPTQTARARRERKEDKQALLRALKLKPPQHFEEAHFPRRLTGAVHDFLCSTPADLVGLSLDDLLGEVDPVNVPGVGGDKYPSWRRRTRMTMEEVSWSFEVDDAIRCKRRRDSSGH